MEMKKYQLGEIADVIGGVNFEPTDIEPNGIRILRGGNIQNHTISIKEDDVFLPAQYQDVTNQVQVGDTIIVASTGSVEVLGKAATCFDEIPKTQIGAFLRLLRPKEPQFAMLISIAVNSEHFRKYIRAQAKGTSINNINLGHLKSYEFEAPAKLESISTFYYNIETKMALNRAINHNLEAMAKQLYDYWFVQFDFPNEEGKPYKSSGGKMVWNEKLKREIPEGWDISLIKDIATTYSGGTPKSTNIEYYDNGEIAWINSGELNSPIITKTTNYITKCGLENSSAKLYPSNSILVAMYGATAGKVSLLTFEACSNQAVCGVIPTIENMLYYVYFHISSLYSHFITLSTGSARDNISQDTIKNILLPIPTRNILKLFDEKIGSIYQTIVNNYQQIDSLTKQRDELLPLLMNGQVSVNYDLSHD